MRFGARNCPTSFVDGLRPDPVVRRLVVQRCLSAARALRRPGTPCTAAPGKVAALPDEQALRGVE